MRKRDRREREHLPAPGHGLALEVVQRDDRVHQSPVESLFRPVLTAEEPHLLGPLEPDGAGQDRRAVPPVEAPDLGPGLAESCVVGRNGDVADQVQDVPAADGVAGDHGDDRLGDAAHQDLEVEDVEAADAALGDLVVTDVAVVTPDLLVPARAEGVGALAAEDDGADVGVVPGHGEGVRQLEERLGTEGVPPLRAADRQLCDALCDVVADVLERTSRLPRRQGKRAEIVEGIMRTSCDHGLHGDLRYWPVPELVALDLPGGIGFVDALRAIWDTGDAAAPLDPRLPPIGAPGAARRVAPDADRRLRR